MHKWTTEFEHDRKSLEDDPRSGEHKTGTSPKIVEKGYDMVMHSRRLKVSKLLKG